MNACNPAATQDSVQIAVQNDTLHVVRQDIFGHAHPLERMNHPDEQVFLLGIGKELHIALSAVMTNHGETGHREFLSVAGVFLHFGKAPIHLEGFAGAGSVPASTVSAEPRLDALPERDPVGGNVVLNGRDPGLRSPSA